MHKMNSSDSLKLWLSEVNSEIKFWDNLFASKGRNGGDPEIFQYRINPKCPFQISKDLESENSRVLDVGSGPYSRLGYIYNDRMVDLTLVDPLAYVYKKLECKYGFDFVVSPRTGLVECLSLLLPRNQYDLVHMSNSLDHSFDPVEGIKQLLYVTRVGGKVILRHHNNVAEEEGYEGLHQWNLTTQDDHFIIWNKKYKIDMNDLIKDFATVEYAAYDEETTLGSKWIYQKVVIRKNKEFEHNSIYAGDVLVQLCEYIMQYEMQKCENEKLTKVQKLFKVLK